MEFREILMRASEQQGMTTVPKRYSLAVGPPKKDPKVKGVHSAAVQAFLRRQEEEQRKKVLEEKRRKEELLAKRVELKHDRKARAMASRTKDNFHGYNGIPMEEKPRKRQGSENRKSEFMDDDYMMQESHTQSDSELESEEYEEKPSRNSEKPKVLPKSAPSVMNFSDLLKLAEKKQHEPVEIKIVKKTEERPLTAEELREREYLERRNKKAAVLKEKKLEKEMKHRVASGFSKKDISQKELVNAKFSKHSADKHYFSKETVSSQNSTNKNSKRSALSEKPSKPTPCSKTSHPEKIKSAHKGLLKSPPNSNHIKSAPSGGGKTGSKSHAPVLKTAANGALRQSSAKELYLKKDSTHKKSTNVASTQQESYKNSISKQTSNNSVSGGLPVQSKNSLKTGQPASSLVTGLGSCGMGPRRSENSSGQGQQNRISSTGPSHAGSGLNVRSGRPGVNSGPARLGSSQGVSPGQPNTSLNTGLGRGSSSGPGPGRPSTASVQTLKPKCTVVSETISSKNLVPRQVNPQMNGMRPFSHQRSGIPPRGFPKTSLPPISYKRQLDDDEDEYDSEMEDFIDDEGEPQEEISKHIREIFGYDRSRYKDESDYALRYMESSWKEQQKEEAKSLRLGMQEDLEEMRREEEELKRRKQTKKLRPC